MASCNDNPSPGSSPTRRAPVALRNEKVYRHRGGLVVTAPLGPIQANCYIVVDEPTATAIVIDPGGDAEAIAERVRQAGWTASMILATHGHIDHIAAVATLKTLLGVPLGVHGGDRPSLARAPESARMYGYPRTESPEIDRDLAEVSALSLGAATIRVVATPGHSPGSCCFHLPAWRVVFTGDTLFHRSVGRTDLPGGSHAVLQRSIRQQLYTLDGDVTCYCGHEEPTTIGEERRFNPFVR